MKKILMIMALLVGSFNALAQDSSRIIISRPAIKNNSAVTYAYRIGNDVQLARNGESVSFIVPKNEQVVVEMNYSIGNETVTGFLIIGGSKLKDEKWREIIVITPTDDKHLFNIGRQHKLDPTKSQFNQVF